MLLSGQDLLIKDLLSNSVSIRGNLISWKSKKQIIVTRSVQEYNIELWPQPLVNLFGLNNYLKNCNLEMSLKWHLYVIVRLLFILVLILFFMKGPGTLRLIVILFEKILCLKTSRLSLLTQVINWQIFSLSLRESRIVFVTSLVHNIYMHQLEGEC